MGKDKQYQHRKYARERERERRDRTTLLAKKECLQKEAIQVHPKEMKKELQPRPEQSNVAAAAAAFLNEDARPELVPFEERRDLE